MVSNENLEQELRQGFEKAFSGTDADTRVAGVDLCKLYRLVPDSLKKKLGDWIEQKLGKFARYFYDILIGLADKACPA